MKTLLILLLSLTVLASDPIPSPQNSLYSLNKSNFADIIKGNQRHSEIVHKFGANAAVGTSLTPISSSGTYQTPTTLQSLEILSDDNTNDIPAGTGALTITVMGLSTDWLEVSETIALNGTTAVPLVNQYYRLYRMAVTTSGTYASLAGASHSSTITVRGAGAGVTWGMITPEAGFGLGQSEIGLYSVPAGKKAYLLSANVNIEATKVVTLILYKREGADTIVAPFSPMKVVEIVRGSQNSLKSNIVSPVPVIIGPADIGYMAKVAVGSAAIEVDFEILLEDID